MAKIQIRDLLENATLDRQAMRAIVGGARSTGRQLSFDSLMAGKKRIIDYPVTRPLTKGALPK